MQYTNWCLSLSISVYTGDTTPVDCKLYVVLEHHYFLDLLAGLSSRVLGSLRETVIAEFIIHCCIGLCMLLLQQECCHHNIFDFQSLLAWERSVIGLFGKVCGRFCPYIMFADFLKVGSIYFPPPKLYFPHNCYFMKKQNYQYDKEGQEIR